MSALIFNSAVFSQKYGNMIPEIFNQLVAAVTAFENDRGEGFGEEEEGAISMESPSGLSSAFSKLHYASSNEPHEYDRLVPVGPVQALAKSFHSFATVSALFCYLCHISSCPFEWLLSCAGVLANERFADRDREGEMQWNFSSHWMQTGGHNWSTFSPLVDCSCRLWEVAILVEHALAALVSSASRPAERRTLCTRDDRCYGEPSLAATCSSKSYTTNIL